MSSLTTHLNMITQDRFLALAGLMLGKVSMPYNRERLEAGLVAFFNDSTVRRNLLSSVTAGESRILSLLHTFHSLSQTQLSDLLEYRNHKAFSRTPSTFIHQRGEPAQRSTARGNPPAGCV